MSGQPELNLHLARYLIAVVEDGHFGRAAQRLFISPPALSQQIRKLERQYGVTLLGRSRHPIQPTAVGLAFVTEARAAVEAADRAGRVIAGHLRQRSGILRLGFVSPAGPHVRPVLDQVSTTVPRESIQMVQLDWGRQTRAVADGTVDAAFVRPPVTDHDEVQVDTFLVEPRVVALPLRHRLAHLTSVTIGDLDAETHVIGEDADPAWGRWWAVDPRPSGVPVRYGPVVRTIDELVEVVAGGSAVAITAASVAMSYQRADVVFVPIRDVSACVLALCSRIDETNPLVHELRHAAHRVRRAHPEQVPIHLP